MKVAYQANLDLPGWNSSYSRMKLAATLTSGRTGELVMSFTFYLREIVNAELQLM